jgi:uncharacterized protein YdhG (YjbR/CyaY superfamily)
VAFFPIEDPPMAMTAHASVDKYIAAQPAAVRPVLVRMRAILRKALPGAEEGISYQIPVYKLDGRVVVFFSGWKDHLSLYPATAGLREALGKELEPFLAGKGTLRFPLTGPLPAKLIAQVARVRAREAAAAEKAAAAKKTARAKKSAPRRAAGTARKSAG